MINELMEYKNFSAKINAYLASTMQSLGMTVENYNHEKIWAAMMHPGVTLRSFPAETTMLLGMVIKDSFETTIAYNADMNKEYLPFIISHELTHYLYHSDHSSHFYDTKQTLASDARANLLEFQANIGASALLLPNAVLIYALKQGETPAAISRKFFISEKAIKLRLIRMLQIELALSLEEAQATSERIFKNTGSTVKEWGEVLAANSTF